MFKKVLLAAAAGIALAGPAMAGCDADFDTLSKAVNGPTSMPDGHRAAMMRHAVHAYDACMAGDTKNSAGLRDMIMEQIRMSLGGK